MKNINKECSPHLIFPEFIKKKWHFLPLKNIATIRNERAGNKKCILLSVSSGIGLISQKEKFGREIAGKQYERYFLVYENDFVYNKSATKTYPQGTINLYHNKELAAVPSSIFMCFYVDFNIINVFYLKYLFEFNIHGKWLKNFITTGARAHGSFNIDSKDFLSIPIPIPLGEKSLSEQQKIADCLSSLDELIEAHEQKLDALKQHKKGLMQRLFPAEGETTPRWRFPEFRNAGEWEKTRLGSLIAVAMCKRIFSEETSTEGDIPFYKIGTLGKTPDAFISYDLFQNYKNKYKYPKKGEILLTCSGTIGKIIRYSGEDAYYQDSNIVWLENDQNIIINDFLFFFLSKFNWTNLNVTTITRIYSDDLKKILLFFPKNHNEQQKIADCLISLDEQIKAQEEKISALKEHKKGMIQQLFPLL